MAYNQMKGRQLPPFIKLRNDDGTEDIYYSIFYQGCPDEIKMIAQKELNETEENKRKGIQYLRNTLKCENIIFNVEDIVLIQVLRNCKYNFKKSATKLIKYLKTRQRIIEMLQRADMEKLSIACDHMCVGLLPYRDIRGRAIFFTTPNVDFDLFDMEDAICCYYAVLHLAFNVPISSITGLIHIAESKTPRKDVIYQVMKTFRHQIGNIVTLPGRVAKIELLNENPIVRWCFNMLKPILSGKIVERIDFHGSNIEELRKIYHPALLPTEFGGTMGPLCNNFYKEELLNMIKKLKDEIPSSNQKTIHN